MKKRNKVFVLGLDGVPPQLLFHTYRRKLPHFARLMEQGAWGALASSHPPITIPAWSCMFSGRDPGELGCYGFSTRKGYTYERPKLSTSAMISAPRLWEMASAAGLEVIVLGVPQTYPPTPVRGILVAGLLTPSKRSSFTYPAALARKLDTMAGADGYIIDIDNFRSEDKETLYAKIRAMTRSRFQVARYLLTHHPWDLFCMVELGPDRMHHGFWRFSDPTHRLYQAGNALEYVLLEYYQLLDEELGKLLDMFDEHVSLFVVSDHGARALGGGVCLNEWLLQKGWLKVRAYPSSVTPLDPENVIWSQSRVWAEGGYCGRLWLNISGREPQGLVKPEEIEAFISRLRKELCAIVGHQGMPLETVAYRPQELYREQKGFPPDLLVYLGNLAWRAIGTIGHRAIHLQGNDTGPDDANHDPLGIFLARDAQVQARGEMPGLTLYDICPTVLDRLGLPIPAGLQGRVIR